jgi:hypothetical protein
MREQLERAYAVGDQRTARALALALLAEPGAPEQQARARQILRYTSADPFLAWVGLLGLGLVAWLVYNYVW